MENELKCQKQTKDLLCLLNKAKTKKDFIEIVIATQIGLKTKLLKYGTKFYPHDHQYSEDIVGQSVFKDTEIIEAKSYVEINFIRRGLKFGWVTENLPGFELMEIRKYIELRWNKFNEEQI